MESYPPIQQNATVLILFALVFLYFRSPRNTPPVQPTPPITPPIIQPPIDNGPPVYPPHHTRPPKGTLINELLDFFPVTRAVVDNTKINIDNGESPKEALLDSWQMVDSIYGNPSIGFWQSTLKYNVNYFLETIRSNHPGYLNKE